MLYIKLNVHLVQLQRMEPFPKLLTGDQILLTECSNHNNKKISGWVEKTSSSGIIIRTLVDLDCATSYDVHFVLNRLIYRFEHTAVQRAITNKICDLLVPKDVPNNVDTKMRM